MPKYKQKIKIERTVLKVAGHIPAVYKVTWGTILPGNIPAVHSSTS